MADNDTVSSVGEEQVGESGQVAGQNRARNAEECFPENERVGWVMKMSWRTF